MTFQLWPKRLSNSTATNYIHENTRPLSKTTHYKNHFFFKNKTFSPGILVLNIPIASDIVKAATNYINKDIKKLK